MSDTISLGGSLLMSLLGMAVVFLVLVILMAVIRIMSAAFKTHSAAPSLPEASAPLPAASASAVSPAAAPGSAGEVKAFDVPDRTAAVIMAIVAEQTDTPLNRLRFKSIRQINP